MKINILSILALAISLNVLSQKTGQSCENITDRAVKYLVGSKNYEQDIAQGIKMLTIYAEDGCSLAQLKLGETYSKNKFVPIDGQKAFRYTKLAADQGNKKAAQLLVKLCQKGIGCNLQNSSYSHIYKSSMSELKCEKKAKKAFEFIQGSPLVDSDIATGMRLLNKYAEQRCPEALFLLGLIYKKGYFDDIEADEDKAFKYLNQAVDAGHIRANAHLGQLYERGFGCRINYKKAFKYFKNSIALGDDMGAYCIGYDYMKGLGTVEQSYDKAIRWFKKSDYPMAKHWLAILHYFGFGTPVDKDRALELLLSNGKIKRSPRLLEHFEKNKNNSNTILGEPKTIDNIFDNGEAVGGVVRSKKLNIDDYADIKGAEVTGKTVKGNWKGRLVEYDWSGTHILRSFPIHLKLKKDNTGEGFSYIAKVDGILSKGKSTILDESMYFDDFQIALPNLFKDDKTEFLNTDILSATMKIREIDGNDYISAKLESRVVELNEPGTPMFIVAIKNASGTENDTEMSDALIHSLNQQHGNNFITTFPNPFVDELLIQYNLEEPVRTTVEIYSLYGSYYRKILDNKYEGKGNRTHSFDGSYLEKDSYHVVKVTAGNDIYTKLIIKE